MIMKKNISSIWKINKNVFATLEKNLKRGRVSKEKEYF